MNKQEMLHQIFGYRSFRPGQEELIDTLMAGQDVLGIMPTGAGKSMCYQLPALLLPGVTLVISPLISLMKDQVSALTQVGVAAAYLNSALSPRQYEAALSNAERGQYKIIYVSPERLATPRFQELLRHITLSAVIVDEAHCVSQWGHDFRPSYIEIRQFLAGLTPRPVVGAFTATATEQVRRDIIDLLALKAPHVLVTGFNRENLYFEVLKPKSKNQELLRLLRSRQTQSGVVYCSTRAAVEDVCELLCSHGIAATRYHAGLDLAERQRNQTDFVYDQKQVMVATNAFGMGIDKSNVSFVIHYNMPKNMESYYQEAGRAGRDGEAADCILLYSPKDVQTNRFLINNSQEQNEDMPPELRQAVLQSNLDLLRAMTFYATTTECLRQYMLRYFGEDAPIHCGNCSCCNQNYDTVDITVDAQKIVSCLTRIQRTGRSVGKHLLATILHGGTNAKISQNRYHDLPTYGTMAQVPQRRIIYIIEFLVGQGFLTLSDGDYPVLSVNAASSEVLRGDTPLFMKVPQMTSSKTATSVDQAGDGDLFDTLVALRFKLAQERGVAAYVIFTNASLRSMSQTMPQTDEAFLEVPGVGQAKLKQYGAIFMQAIADYQDGGK